MLELMPSYVCTWTLWLVVADPLRHPHWARRRAKFPGVLEPAAALLSGRATAGHGPMLVFWGTYENLVKVRVSPGFRYPSFGASLPLYVHIYIHTQCIYIYMYIYMYGYIYIYMYICISTCLCVCIFIYIYKYVHRPLGLL